MKTKIHTQTTVTETVYLSEDELEEIIQNHVGNMDAEVCWDEYSQGGIRGCSVVSTTVSYRDGE